MLFENHFFYSFISALSSGDVELQNKLRRMTCSINRTFCLFDEFECLYEETKLPKLITTTPAANESKPAVMQTSVEIQTDSVCQNDSIIGRSSSKKEASKGSQRWRRKALSCFRTTFVKSASSDTLAQKA